MATKPVRSVDRAVDIVLAFVDTPVMGVAELQQRLELPRPTLYRMLSALEQKGLLSWFGEPRRYRLGHKVLELAGSWQRSFDLVEISIPALQRLWEACDETVMLFVPHPPDGRILVLLRMVGLAFPAAHAVDHDRRLRRRSLDRAD